MSSLLMHVHPWDLPRPLYHSLSWCHPCIAPMAFLFISFSTHHAVPREEARGRSSSAAACSTSCLVYFLVVVVLVTGSENATLATVMVCRCFTRFPIWSVWASHTLWSSIPQAQVARKTSGCCQECCSVMLISWRSVLSVSVLGLWAEIMREKGRNCW